MSKDTVNNIRKYLKHKILNNKEFLGHEKKRSQVLDLFRKTVEYGESNSMLLIGPKGVGKTMLVNSVLEELQASDNFREDSIIVKLHGLIHTDDRLALRSITYQMNLDNAVDGKVFGSFAENLAFLLACLKTGEKHSSKSVIFILEEFDLFCAHHNQTLLYNLFDISQSAQAPICVVGITCRLDVIQLLEKRVKSRFSHRQMFLYDAQEDNQISDIDFTLERIKWYLSIPDKCPVKISIPVKKQWNTSVQNLLKNTKFRQVIQRLIDIELNENILKNVLLKCIFSLSETTATLTPTAFEKELILLEKDDMVQILKDLSVLELCLIVSMKHHCDIYDNQPMNFEMVYSRFVQFANKHSSMQSVQRAVVMKAFEHIENLELISMTNQGNSRIQKEYQFFKLLVLPQQITEAISKSPGLPTEVIQWANSSLA